MYPLTPKVMHPAKSISENLFFYGAIIGNKEAYPNYFKDMHS
jgi:hypothetical protein